MATSETDKPTADVPHVLACNCPPETWERFESRQRASDFGRICPGCRYLQRVEPAPPSPRVKGGVSR